LNIFFHLTLNHRCDYKQIEIFTLIAHCHRRADFSDKVQRDW